MSLNEIWLQPICDECQEPSDRQEQHWCQDDLWTGSCENCGASIEAIKYIRASKTIDLRAGNEDEQEPV